MQYILASQSPQRKKILEELGLSFKIVPAHIDEHHNGLTKMHAIARSIALRKALKVAKKHPDSWIIACDTMVLISDGTIAVKPESKEEARMVLNKYRNSHCDVYSGLALVNLKEGFKETGYERSRIHFLNVPNKQIEDYLDSGAWEGRSGSLTIEDSGDWVSSIEGDYWNIVGLPVNLLKKMIKKAES